VVATLQLPLSFWSPEPYSVKEALYTVPEEAAAVVEAAALAVVAVVAALAVVLAVVAAAVVLTVVATRH